MATEIETHIRNPVEWVRDQFDHVGQALTATARALEGAEENRSAAPPAVRRIDARAARALPGIHAVLTLDDLAPVLISRRMLRHSNSGVPLDRLWPFALADGEVSYVGEAVAIVVADSRYHAEDAAARVTVDYELLPAVADCRAAVAPGAGRRPSAIVPLTRRRSTAASLAT